MVSTPFIAFYVIGMVLQSGWDYLLKLGAFITLYVAVYLMNHFVFDERLFHILPMSIYLATKVNVIPRRALDNRDFYIRLVSDKLPTVISNIVDKVIRDSVNTLLNKYYNDTIDKIILFAIRNENI